MKRLPLIKKDSPQSRYPVKRSYEDTKIEIIKQLFTRVRHCEERVSGEFSVHEVGMTVEIYKQRGNLPSLINPQEIFINDMKASSLQTQSREIVSWIKQWFACLTFNTFSPETRNDEERERVGCVLRTTVNSVVNGIYYDFHGYGALSAPYESSVNQSCRLARRTI
jgi:hypothetical protein